MERLHDKDVKIDATKYEPDVEPGSEKLNNRPVVVGFGPAGIFAALMLAEKGFTLVKLREYQEDVLHLMADEVWDPEINDVMFKNRKVILLQSR